MSSLKLSQESCPNDTTPLGQRKVESLALHTLWHHQLLDTGLIIGPSLHVSPQFGRWVFWKTCLRQLSNVCHIALHMFSVLGLPLGNESWTRMNSNDPKGSINPPHSPYGEIVFESKYISTNHNEYLVRLLSNLLCQNTAQKLSWIQLLEYK